MRIPRFLRPGRDVKPIIAEEPGRGKRFFDHPGGAVSRDKRDVPLSFLIFSLQSFL